MTWRYGDIHARIQRTPISIISYTLHFLLPVSYFLEEILLEHIRWHLSSFYSLFVYYRIPICIFYLSWRKLMLEVRENRTISLEHVFDRILWALRQLWEVISSAWETCLKTSAYHVATSILISRAASLRLSLFSFIVFNHWKILNELCLGPFLDICGVIN